MDIQRIILDQVEAYLEASGMKPTIFGLRAVNDGHFVTRLRDGANLTTRTIGRVQAFIAENPPGRCEDATASGAAA